ncbi:MAG: hypothetical protein KGH64_05455 [Candidatus Micrarchaeota archaeon]|nr:hypothetical protein [Candidatus Micrarchaeota archaeon]
MSNKEPTFNKEALEQGEREGLVMMSRVFRYDHLKHEIPLGSLVEAEVSLYHSDPNGAEVFLNGKCKLYVIGHHRDCDGTPLYSLCDMPVASPRDSFSTAWIQLKSFSHVFQHGYSEEQLTPTGKVVTLYADVHSYMKG